MFHVMRVRMNYAKAIMNLGDCHCPGADGNHDKHVIVLLGQ